MFNVKSTRHWAGGVLSATTRNSKLCKLPVFLERLRENVTSLVFGSWPKVLYLAFQSFVYAYEMKSLLVSPPWPHPATATPQITFEKRSLGKSPYIIHIFSSFFLNLCFAGQMILGFFPSKTTCLSLR